MDPGDPRRATMPYIDDEYDEYYVALFIRFLGLDVTLPDGPLSVQDQGLSTMNQDEGVGSHRPVHSSQNSTRNHHDSPAMEHSPSNKRSDHGEVVQSDGGNYVNNTQVDKESRRRPLTLEQLKEKLSTAVSQLQNMAEYHLGDGLKLLKLVSDIYWERAADRRLVGDFLAELGFAELVVKMLRHLNSQGIFKSDDIWFPTYYTYKTCWNYSDASSRLATNMAESGIVKLMTLNLCHGPYLENVLNKNVYYVLKASVSTLYNIARCSGLGYHFREVKTAEIILPLVNSTDDYLKSVAILILAYIVEDKENARFFQETDIIKEAVQLLNKSADTKQKGGLTPVEVVEGMCHVAAHDANKLKLVQEGVLAELVPLLRGPDHAEQAACAKCLWVLAFDKKILQKMLEFPELMATLENLKNSENHVVKKNVRGALWMLKDIYENTSFLTNSQSSKIIKNQIFLSCSPSERHLVQPMLKNLTTEGFKTWVDWEQMGTASPLAVAEALKNSAVVMGCLSERFLFSPACRADMELALRLKKDLVPLLIQRQFVPEGWLADVLTGAGQILDFSGHVPYDQSFQSLLKELRLRAVTTNLPDHNHKLAAETNSPPTGVQTVGTTTPRASTSAGNTPKSTSANTTTVTSTSCGTPHKVTPHSTGSTSKVTPANVNTTKVTSAVSHKNASGSPAGSSSATALRTMSNEHVEHWLASKGLQRLTTAFSQIDGQLIWQLKKLRETTPEYFYNILERQFGMSLVDILRFNAALDTLQ